MVFEDNTIQNGDRPKGIKYTKSPLELNDLFSRVVSDDDSYALAQGIIAKYGYPKASTKTAAAHKLAAIVQNAGESVFQDIANIHPDKDLILSLCSPPAPEPQVITKEVIREVATPTTSKEDAVKEPDVFVHDCGCKHHSAEGHHHHRHYAYDVTTDAATTKESDTKYLKPMLLLSFTALACVVIWKIK